MQPLKSSSTPEVFPRNGIKHISPQDLIFQMWRRSRFFQSAAIHRDSARTILGLFQWEGSCSITACTEESPCGTRGRKGSCCANACLRKNQLQELHQNLAAGAGKKGVASQYMCYQNCHSQHLMYLPESQYCFLLTFIAHNLSPIYKSLTPLN